MHVLKKCFANNATRSRMDSKIIGYLESSYACAILDFKIIGSFKYMHVSCTCGMQVLCTLDIKIMHVWLLIQILEGQKS